MCFTQDGGCLECTARSGGGDGGRYENGIEEDFKLVHVYVGNRQGMDHVQADELSLTLVCSAQTLWVEGPVPLLCYFYFS